MLKPTRYHRPEVPRAVLPSPSKCCALAANYLLAPPLGTQSHSKSQLCPQCAQRCVRERPKTKKNAPLGAQGCQKVPKWSPKGARGDFLGSEKTVVFIAREAYERVSGKLWGSWGTFLQILCDFGCPLRPLWGPIGAKKGVQKRGLRKEARRYTGR